jgi:hypothetical protein
MYKMTQKNNYENSKIYKLVCLDTNITEFYIGSTTAWRQRKSRHKRNCNNADYKQKVYEFIRINGGWGNWAMILIEDFNCSNKRELEKREFELIQELKPTLNMNTNYYNLSKKEYYKVWKEQNKDKVKDYLAKYTQSNKDKKKEYDRIRYLKKKHEV